MAEVKEYRLTLAGIQAAKDGVIQEMPKRVAVDSSPEVASYSMFEEMFNIQLWISKRLQRPFCLIGIKLEDAPSLRETADFSNLLRQGLRCTDLITRMDEKQFLILMPESDSEKVGLAIKRITSKMAGQMQIKIAVAHLPREGGDLKQLVAKLLGEESGAG